MKQVLTIEQMQHLQKLGLDTRNATMALCMYGDDKDFNQVLPNDQDLFERCVVAKYIPAYTLQDVLELLPKEIKFAEKRHRLRIDLEDECIYYYHETIDLMERRDKVFSYYGEELLDAAFQMLYWCIVNKYVKTNKEDKQ